MFYLIWLVILLAGVTLYGVRKRTRLLSQFISLHLMSNMAPGADVRRRWIKGGLLITGLLLAILALTGPLVGFRWEKVEQKGVDVMIALDCSRSMLATDIKPTRLERAKREIIDLLKMMHADRAGLVAFSGSAILQCPLTLDHSGFSLFLKVLEPDYLPMGGTDLSGAIATALNGFEWDVASEKAIILITDGENTTGDPVAVAKTAAEKGVRLFCIGVGRKEGAPIPDAAGGFKKDATGSIVMSRVDDEGLEKIAALARGIYVKSVAGDMDLDRIYKDEILKKMARTTIQSGRKKVWENRFQWVLLPCVLLLFLELVVPEKGKSDQHHSRHHPGLLMILWIACLFCLEGISSAPSAHAGASKSVAQGIEAFQRGEWEKAEKSFIDAQLDRPDMPELYYNIGSAAYKKGDYDSALANFTRAMDTDDTVLKQKATFNLGNTQYRKGNLEEAVKSFEKIPENSPLFSKAHENFEFVKQKIEEQKKAPQGQKSPEDDPKGDSENSNKKDAEKEKDSTSRDKKQQNNDKNSTGQGNKQENKKDIPGSDGQPPAQQPERQASPDPGGKDRKQASPSGEDEKKETGDPTRGAGEKQDERQPGQEKDGAAGTMGQGDKAPDNSEQSRGMGALQPLQQQMLDRLEDQPGRAMMPVYSGRKVDKDW